MAIETLGAAMRQINRLLADGAVTGFSDTQLLEHFVAGHDAVAFEALVARHGPMVLSVCRGILKDPNDAEDAFQATFLILVKKSVTFRGQVALGPWLYRVAHRVAIRANAAAARRRACERRAGEMAAATSTSGPAIPDELVRALHEEIARLPEKLHRAVILCDLQHVPQARAAGVLRLSERTLQRRLFEGRERLKARLIRRGLAPEGGTLGAVFLREAGAAVPAAWGDATVRAALATVNRPMTVGVVSATAKGLTREVLEIMVLQKLTLVSATLLAAGLIAWGASAALVSIRDATSKTTAANPDAPSRRKAEPAVPEPERFSLETFGKVTLRGRVLGPDGRPVPGAKIYRTPLTGNLMRPYPAQESATTGPDGRFQFLADPKAVLPLGTERYYFESTAITAVAQNYGVAWVEVPADGRTDDLTLQLVDDEPITGQIIDLEGKPVPGATLQVLEVRAAAGEDLGAWLEATKDKKGLRKTIEGQYFSRVTIALSPKVMTDTEGRFRLISIGRNRLAMVQLDGPTIASEYLNILTRPGEPIEVLQFQKPRVVATYYGANFRHVAAPTKPVVGLVRDKDTRKPLAGVTVESNKLANDPVPGRNIVQTTTDADGRYRLTGLPKGEGNQIRLVPRDDQPYVSVHALVPDSPGLDPVTVEFELKRGIWIEGKLTDKVTGKPVQGSVDYFALAGNANTRDHPGFDGTIPPHWGVRTKEDGSFRIVGLPGPGLIAVFYTGHHLLVPDRDDEYGSKEPRLDTSPRQLGLLINYTALARIDPAKGVESVRRDVTLDPGWTFTGTVLGPDGKPFAGARSFGLHDRGWSHEAMKTPEFSVQAFNPRRPREVFFQHPEKGLVGVARSPKENGSSVTVNMEPGATITGRLVDTDGKPQAGVNLEVWFRRKDSSFYFDWSDYSPGRIGTDREGRFRIQALLPGYVFRLASGKVKLLVGDGLRSGQTQDLGDVKIKVNDE